MEGDRRKEPFAVEILVGCLPNKDAGIVASVTAREKHERRPHELFCAPRARLLLTCPHER